MELFISYSHKDDDLRQQLSEHLSLLQNEGYLDAWHDRRLMPGDDWAGRIDERLNSAKIILLLISASFNASKYCYDVEMKRALARHEAGEATVIPIILRDCDWKQTAPYRGLNALPRDGKAITSWPNPDEAFTQIAESIRLAIEKWRALPEPSPTAPKRSLPGWVLPYLCDRSDQENVLGPALRAHWQTRPRRPFVCLIHGDEREDHGGFLDRLQKHSLPAVLKLDARPQIVSDLPWSPSRSAANSDQFLQDLGYAVLETTAASAEEVFAALSAYEEPLMLRSELLASEIESGGEKFLDAFLKFCEDGPDLAPGRILIHCISLKYSRPMGSDGLLRQWRIRQKNADWQKVVTEKIDFTKYARLSGVVLPELRGIPRTDVVKWSRLELVRRQRRIEESEIWEVYEDLKQHCDRDGHLPMAPLAEELTELLKGKRKPEKPERMQR